MNVAGPGMRLQGVDDRPGFAPAFGDTGVQLRHYFADRSAVYPLILPKFLGAAVTKDHGRRSEEQHTHWLRIVERALAMCAPRRLY
jgi:hypothetical protein